MGGAARQYALLGNGHGKMSFTGAVSSDAVDIQPYIVFALLDVS
jgi:hypothetical protein